MWSVKSTLPCSNRMLQAGVSVIKTSWFWGSPEGNSILESKHLPDAVLWTLLERASTEGWRGQRAVSQLRRSLLSSNNSCLAGSTECDLIGGSANTAYVWVHKVPLGEGEFAPTNRIRKRSREDGDSDQGPTQNLKDFLPRMRRE